MHFSHPSRSSRVIQAATVVIVALGLRLTVFAMTYQNSQRVQHDDSGSYIRPALNLIHYATFTQLPQEQEFREPDQPFKRGISARVPTDLIATKGPYLYDVFRTPGYPFFLAVIFKTSGYAPLTATFV